MLVFLWLIYQQLLQKGNLQQQWSELQSYWHQAPWYGAALVLLLAPLNWFWESRKWKLAMQKIYAVTSWTSYKAILTGIAFAMVTPGKIGDFAGRILYVPHAKKLKATLATLMTNVIQVMATSLMGCIGIAYFMFNYANEWLKNFLFIFAGLILLIVALVLSSKYWWYRCMQFKIIQTIVKSLRILRRYDKRTIFKIFVLSLCRFLTYNIQFLYLANLLGSQTPWIHGLFATLLFFWLITLIPSLIISDIGVRGFLASMLFIDTGLTANGISLLSASYIIWLLNLILPAILGSLLLLSIRHKKNLVYDTSKR